MADGSSFSKPSPLQMPTKLQQLSALLAAQNVHVTSEDREKAWKVWHGTEAGLGSRNLNEGGR